MNVFKAFDIRGRVPDELNPAVAWAIGYAFTENIRPGHKVAAGLK